MMSILNTSEICDRIFSMSKPSYEASSLLSDETKYLIDNTSYPKYSSSELKSLLKDLKSQPLCQVLAKHNYSFPVLPNSLEYLAKKTEEFNFALDVLSYYTYHTFLSINMLFAKKEGVTYLPTILMMLNNILQNASPDENAENFIIAASSFVDLISTAIYSGLKVNFEDLIPLVTEHFLENSQLPIGSDKIIKILYQKIFSDSSSMDIIGTVFLNSLILILQKSKKSIDPDLICEVLDSICIFIVNLDVLSLKFLYEACEIVSVEYISKLLEPILLQLIESADTQHPILGPYKRIKEGEDICLNNFSTEPTNDSFHPPKNLYVLNETKEISIKFPETIKFKVMINRDLYGKIKLLAKIISVSEELATVFIIPAAKVQKIINGHDKTIVYDEYAILFCLVSAVMKKHQIIIPQCFNDILFDPSVTVFTQCDHFEELNTLRYYAFKFILRDIGLCLNQFLYDCSKFPNLFCECVHRLILLHNEVPFDITLNVSLFANQLIMPFVHYSDIQNKRCRKIRKGLLILFNSFMSNNEKLAKLFSMPVFVEHFFILLFEPPIRQQFIGFLLKYLLSPDYNLEIAEHINKNIKRLITVACSELDGKDALTLLSDLLNTLNEAALFKPEISASLEPITHDLCYNIIGLPEMEGTEDLLMGLITFLATTSHDQTLRANELSLIESAVLHLSTTNPQSRIMEKLVQVIAGHQMSVCNPTFEIKQSKILCSFIRIFMGTDLIFEAIDFISKLCSFSSYNCMKCHDGELDILIIDTVDQWRLSDEISNINEKKVVAYLHLFTQIASVASSVSVVQRFFSMLCPIDTKILSPVHKHILDSLNKIFIASRNYPQAALPMLPSSSLKIQNIPSNEFENGISVVFWLLLNDNPSSYKQNIIIIDDGKRHIFRITMVGNHIKVKIQSGSNSYHGNFELGIPFKIWTMITITLKQSPSHKESIVNLLINSQPIKTISRFAPFFPKTTHVDCLINAPKNNVNYHADNPSYLGLFMLMKSLHNDDVTALVDEGPRPTLTSRYNAIFAYAPQNIGQFYSFHALQKLDGIKNSHLPILSHKKNVSFFDLLLNFCKVSLILPIFGQLDIPLKDGTKFPFLGEMGVELLANLFNLGEQSQLSLCEANGFYVISYLLINSDQTNITFSLYSRYFNLLGSIISRELQRDLVDAILMNIDLWIHCNDKNQIARIVKHWNRTLYPSFKLIIDELRPLEWIVFVLHYYFIPSSAGDRPIMSSRKALLDIANDVTQINNKNKETINPISSTLIKTIVGFICSSKETKSNFCIVEKIDLLKLLTNIFLSCKTYIISSGTKASEIIHYICSLFSSKCDNLIYYALEFIIAVHHMKYELPNPLSYQIEKILAKLQNHKFGDDVFHRLIELMNRKTPELLSLVCLIAINNGENSILYLIKTTSIQQYYYVVESSTVWPVVMLYNSPKHILKAVAEFVIEVFRNHIDKVIFAVNMIGRAICIDDTNVDKIKHIILLKMARFPRFNNEIAFKLMRLIKQFVFFRHTSSKSSILNCALSGSPYQDEVNSQNSLICKPAMKLTNNENNNEDNKEGKNDNINGNEIREEEEEVSYEINQNFDSFLNEDSSNEVIVIDGSDAHIGSPINQTIAPGCSFPNRPNFTKRRSARNQFRQSLGSINLMELKNEINDNEIGQSNIAGTTTTTTDDNYQETDSTTFCSLSYSDTEGAEDSDDEPIKEELLNEEPLNEEPLNEEQLKDESLEDVKNVQQKHKRVHGNKNPSLAKVTLTELAHSISLSLEKGYSLKFGLRFNNQGKWLDADLAAAAFPVFRKHGIMQYSEMIYFLAYYLRHDYPEFVEKEKGALEMANQVVRDEIQQLLANGEQNNARSLLNIEFLLTCKDEMINNEMIDFAYSFINRANHYLSSIYSRKSASTSDSGSDPSVASSSSSIIDEQLLEILEKTLQSSCKNFKEQNKRQMKSNKKDWAHLWRSLTISRAPWAASISESEEEGFKRDNAFCDSFCPYKVRRINNVDKHQKASLLRETGDSELTKRRLSSLVKESPTSLLFCIGDKDTQFSDYSSLMAKSINFSKNNSIMNNDKYSSSTNRKSAKAGNLSNSNKTQPQFVKIELLEQLECQIVTIKENIPAILKLDRNSITISAVKHERVIMSDNIYCLLYRTRNHRFSGIEIFTKSREAIFLVFEGNRFRTIIPRLRLMPSFDAKYLQVQNFEPFFRSLSFTDDWQNGKISNFQYLMYLNIFSGRSYNDASQYPIFPWILNGYSSDVLNLDDPKTYRDLSKPIGAINPDRLNELKKKWEELEMLGEKPYLFANGPTNPLSVYLWLIRLEPFTTQHIDIQGGKFDFAARIFRSISDSYNLSAHNQNDYRELVPEFFFLPEFLKNMSGFDLGETDEGKEVNDVILPPWANGSATTFIYLHRKALESEYVSKHINEWIDLIWGYKQRGEEALKANNVYRHELYADVWKYYPEAIDAQIKIEIEQLQSHIGQIPEQLFLTEHPKKTMKEPQLKSNILTDNNISTIHFEDCNELAAATVSKLTTTTYKKQFMFTLLSASGSIMCYYVDYSLLKSPTISVKYKTRQACINTRVSENDTNNDHDNSVNNSINNFVNNKVSINSPQFIDNGRLCYVDQSQSEVRIIKCDSGSVETLHSNLAIVSIATHPDGWIAIAAKDAAVTLYQDMKMKSPSVSSFRDSIKCISISTVFDALICGTRDNWLLFCRLNNASVNRTVEIKGRPQMILVTDSFGFVVVTMTKIFDGALMEQIALFDINGELISETNHQKITAMTNATSASGFDHLIIADSDGYIYVTEAFYLKFEMPIFKCDSKILSLAYQKEDSIIFAFCENGTAALIYYPICL